MLTQIADRLYQLIEKDSSPAGQSFAWPIGVEMTLHSFKGPDSFPTALLESHRWFKDTATRQEIQSILEWIRGQKEIPTLVSGLLMALQIKYALEYGLHLKEERLKLMLQTLSDKGPPELLKWLGACLQQQRPDLWERYMKGK